jgi:hypothetical protein
MPFDSKDDVENCSAIRSEITTCRSIAHRSIFIFGHARSSTSITGRLINSSPRALILSESNFFIDRDEARWREAYNFQHVSYGNQRGKQTYAPDFIPGRAHTWWEWLAEAAMFYEVVGDKIALTNAQFEMVDQDKIQEFYEARFFNSKFIFLLRDPIQILISTRKLFTYDRDEQIFPHIIGWLKFIMLWCDWIRAFPNTITLTTDLINCDFIDRLSDFTCLDIENGKKLLSASERRQHPARALQPEYQDVETALLEIYKEAKRAAAEDPVLWQWHQKRTLSANNSAGDHSAPAAVEPRAIGQTWAIANQLLTELPHRLSI